MTDDEKQNDELKAALSRARERQRVELLVADIGAAAIAHPEILRVAFASVFDLSAVDDNTQRLILVASDAQRQAREARELLVQLHRDIEDMEGRLDAINHELDQARRRQKAARALAT